MPLNTACAGVHDLRLMTQLLMVRARIVLSAKSGPSLKPPINRWCSASGAAAPDMVSLKTGLRSEPLRYDNCTQTPSIRGVSVQLCCFRSRNAAFWFRCEYPQRLAQTQGGGAFLIPFVWHLGLAECAQLCSGADASAPCRDWPREGRISDLGGTLRGRIEGTRPHRCKRGWPVASCRSNPGL